MFKKLMIISLFLASANLFASSDERELAIRKALVGFTAAWSAHSPEQMAAFWSEDGDLITPRGRWGIGREGTQKVFAEEQSGPMKKSSIWMEITQIRWITEDAALIDANCTVTSMIEKMGTKGKKDKIAAPLNQHLVVLMQKRDGNWKMISVRPYSLQGEVTKVM